MLPEVGNVVVTGIAGAVCVYHPITKFILKKYTDFAKYRRYEKLQLNQILSILKEFLPLVKGCL